MDRMYVRKPKTWDPAGNCPLCRIPFKDCSHEEDYVNRVVKDANEQQLRDDLKRDLNRRYPIRPLREQRIR